VSLAPAELFAKLHGRQNENAVLGPPAHRLQTNDHALAHVPVILGEMT
jgi:hypothetical protein